MRVAYKRQSPFLRINTTSFFFFFCRNTYFHETGLIYIFVCVFFTFCMYVLCFVSFIKHFLSRFYLLSLTFKLQTQTHQVLESRRVLLRALDPSTLDTSLRSKALFDAGVYKLPFWLTALDFSCGFYSVLCWFNGRDLCCTNRRRWIFIHKSQDKCHLHDGLNWLWEVNSTELYFPSRTEKFGL